MKVSYNWLREFVPFTQTPEQLAELLTHLGMAVDGIDEVGAKWVDVMVGKVLTCDPVPKSDHLSHCTVDAGGDSLLSVVCGAPNVRAGQVVPVAIVGAVLPGDFRIEQRKVRGVLSQGMICSERELGLSEESHGIMVLPPDLKIGARLESYLAKKDWIFDLEITFNRPDCLSHIGVAREIAAVTGLALVVPASNPVECDTPTKQAVSVEITAPAQCHRYGARVVNGVTIAPSPLWMRERLRSLGIRPISNVVDVTNYVMLEMGHPLHAFDYHRVRDGKIIVRPANMDEKFTTLDNKEHTLSRSDLLIADADGGIALAGVMGGLNSEIKDDTRDVLIECAVFEKVGIRTTSRDHLIFSESSRRFERGVDPQAVALVINRTAQLIQQTAGGTVLKGIVDNYPKKWRQRVVHFRPTRCNHLLGIRIQGYKMVNYLSALGCGVSADDPKEYLISPPSWRHDLDREIDMVEEVARLHGYDRISLAESSGVPLMINAVQEHERRMVDKVKQTMVELGFQETISIPLIAKSDLDRLPSTDEPVRVLNPLSEDMGYLRPTLAISLLRVAERNDHAGIRDLKIFEWGTTFRLEKGQILERRELCGLMAGNVGISSWKDKNSRPSEIWDIKGVVKRLLEKISIDKASLIDYDIDTRFSLGGKIVGGDEGTLSLGWFGKVSPDVAERFGVDFPLYLFTLDGDALLKTAGTVPQYKQLPRFPSANRDLAFVINADIKVGLLEETIRSAGGELLESAQLFDIYQGAGVDDGKKSIAFHLTFRSTAKTLSDVEVETAISRIITTAGDIHNAVLRAL